MARKILIGAGIVAVLLVATIAVLGAMTPTDLQVEREILIYKPKEVVFEDLKYVKNHDRWSPWIKRDPNMVREFKGEDGTVGFISSWSGNEQVGVGEQEITKIAEGERIDYELRFSKPMQDASTTYLITEALAEDQTKVRWGLQGKMPFPGNVICMVMNMKQTMAKDFDEGLAMLKADLEKRP